MSGAGRAVAISLLAHVVPLVAVQWPQSRPPAAWRPERQPLTVALRREPPPPRPSVDLPTPEPDRPPRKVEIRRRRTIHAAPRREPEPRIPGPEPQPAFPGLPIEPFAPPVFSAPSPALPPAVVQLLSRTTLAGAQELETPRGTARLYFLQPGESVPAVLAREGPPLVLLAALDEPPADGAGVTWAEVDSDAPWLNDPAVKGWWALWGTVPPRIGRTSGAVAALWLPSCVRAGWETESSGALALWDKLELEPSLAGLMSGG